MLRLSFNAEEKDVGVYNVVRLSGVGRGGHVGHCMDISRPHDRGPQIGGENGLLRVINHIKLL